MNLARLVACARYTPPGRGTTTIGRFPGSRVIARCPPSQYRGSNPAPVASLDSALSGYSCGGSAGLEPASLLARVTGHRWRRRGELAGTLLRCKRNYVLGGKSAVEVNRIAGACAASGQREMRPCARGRKRLAQLRIFRIQPSPMPLELAYRPIELPGVAATAYGEQRPRDFAARIRRRDMRSIRNALRAPSLMRQRLGGVAMFGVLGLLLGPTGWGEPGGVQAAVARAQMAGLQPFERGGDSFPGSAFYWLDTSDSGLIAPTEAQAKWDQSHSDAEILSARPVSAAGSSEDRWRALQCLTAAIYYEAASEPDGGQRAVAQV